jgi:hypothetical protein
VVCDGTIVKQKRQACAAFLGVLAVSINVLRVCCILTTIFWGFRATGTVSGTGKSSIGGRPAETFCESTFP